MGARVFILGDGTRATVPDESIDKWMQRMDTRGVKFRDADMSAEMTVGEPQVIKSTDRPEEIPTLDNGESPPRARDEIQVTPKPEPDGIPFTHSAARGFMHGATLGLYDAKIPGVDKSLPELFGEPSYEDARAANPTSSVVGDVVGAVASPVGKLGQAAQGAGLLARTARAGLAGAAESGVRGLAEGEDPERAAKIGGGVSAALSAVSPMVGRGVGRVADAVGDYAGPAADAMRARAVGVFSREAKALADKLGIDVNQVPKEIAQLVERVSPSGWTGKGAGERAADLAGEMRTIGDHLEQAYGRAGSDEGLDAFVPGAWTQIAQRLGLQAGRAPSATGGERALRGALATNAAEVAAEAPPSSLRGLQQRKSAWQGEGHSGVAGNVPDVAAKEAAALQGRIAREELEDVMQYATPQTQLDVRTLNHDYAKRAELEQLARARAATEATDSSVPAAVAAGVGSAALGPWGAALALISGSKSQALQQLSKSRGLDALANVGREVESYAPRIAQGARDVGDGIASGSRRVGNFVSDILDPDDEEERRY